MNDFLQNLLYAVITAVVPVLVGYAVAFLKAKRDKELQKIDNIYIEDTIRDATDIVIDAVDTVAQTYVDDLRKVGKFTPEEQKVALEKAITQAKDLMSSDAISLISTKYNDLDTWITSIIESYIKSTKK
jgi:ribonuclease PH